MKFSLEVKNIISASKKVARKFNNEYLTPEHLFLGLISCNSKVTISILNDLGVKLNNLAETLEDAIKGDKGKNINRIDLSTNVKQILKDSSIEAKIFKSKNIESFHLLAAILLDNENKVTKQLKDLGINYKVFASHIKYRIYTNEIEIEIVKSQLKFKELLFIGKVSIMKVFTKNQIQTDRKIVELFANEIFIKRGTSDSFQDKLYNFLDSCKVKKDQEEFHYLVEIVKKKLSLGSNSI